MVCDAFIEELCVVGKALLRDDPEATLADALVKLLIIKGVRDYSKELING